MQTIAKWTLRDLTRQWRDKVDNTNTKPYSEWFNQHTYSCLKNFEGSSQAMGAESWKQNTKPYLEWFNQHVVSSPKNFERSSQAMEVESLKQKYQTLFRVVQPTCAQRTLMDQARQRRQESFLTYLTSNTRQVCEKYILQPNFGHMWEQQADPMYAFVYLLH